MANIGDIAHAGIRSLNSIKIAIVKYVLIVSGLLLTGLIFAQVVIRYFTTGSVYGIEELAICFALWFYFIGAARGAYTRSHVSASLLDISIREGSAKRLLELIVSILTAGTSIWVTVWAIRYVHWVNERSMVSLDLGFSMVYVHASVAIGMILMSFYFCRDVVIRLFNCRDGGLGGG